MLAFKDDKGVWTQWVGQPMIRLTGDDKGSEFQLPVSIDTGDNPTLFDDWGLKVVTQVALPQPEYGKVIDKTQLVDDGSGNPIQEVVLRDWTQIEFNQEKSRLLGMVPVQLNQATAPIMGFYPEAERSGWVAKESEARAYMASNPKDPSLCPLVFGVASAQIGHAADEATLTAMAQIIIDKADAFRQVSIGVEAARIAGLTQISKAATSAELKVADQTFTAIVQQISAQVQSAAQA